MADLFVYSCGCVEHHRPACPQYRLVDDPRDAEIAALKAEVSEQTARAERAEAERDAAVARNIKLKGEVEKERAMRVPVADYFHRVVDVINGKIRGLAPFDNSHARTVMARLEEVIEEISNLDGWDGTEGGFAPGLQTTHYVWREAAEKDLASMRDKHVIEMGLLIDWLKRFADSLDNTGSRFCCGQLRAMILAIENKEHLDGDHYPTSELGGPYKQLPIEEAVAMHVEAAQAAAMKDDKKGGG